MVEACAAQENLELVDITEEEANNNQAMQNQQASDAFNPEGSSGGEWKSQNIKVVTYDDILKPKVSSLANQIKTISKSQQDHIDALSLKSDDHRRHTIVLRDHMIFGSMSHRENHEVPKIDKMNHSQMSH